VIRININNSFALKSILTDAGFVDNSFIIIATIEETRKVHRADKLLCCCCCLLRFNY